MSQRETISSVLAARGQQRREDRAAEAEQARKDAAQRFEQRRQRRAEHGETLRSWVRWAGAHPVDLLMSVIVIVPAVLAWSAMAAYGVGIYGPHGAILPALTEGAMWAFAFASRQAKAASRPVWMLLIGLWVFAAVAAGLNYTHGVQVSVGVGVVMAVVSISGVVAHQLHMASDRPLRSRAQRHAAKRERIGQRREHRMAIAATRQAAGQVSADGSVELLVREGTVTVRRNRLVPWRSVVTYGPVLGIGQDGPASETVADEVEAFLADLDTAGTGSVPNVADTPKPAGRDLAADQQRDRGQDTPVPDAEDASEAGSVTPLRSGRSWGWDELVAAFWTHVAEGRVTPTSQRNVRLVLGCSRARARELVALYESRDDGGPAAVAA